MRGPDRATPYANQAKMTPLQKLNMQKAQGERQQIQAGQRLQQGEHHGCAHSTMEQGRPQMDMQQHDMGGPRQVYVQEGQPAMHTQQLGMLHETPTGAEVRPGQQMRVMEQQYRTGWKLKKPAEGCGEAATATA